MSGSERIRVTYGVTAPASEIQARALAIALEQTVELPERLVPRGYIRDEVVGHIEHISERAPGVHEVTLSYLVEAAGGELTQLLNLLFGNSSLQPGVRVLDVRLPESFLRQFRGPRFGMRGLRDFLGVPTGPLVQTALKPMGLSPGELAEMAYQLALGGIDIIKDDHGLTNQSWAPFEARVSACAAAVERANRETGRRAVYAANVTSDFRQLERRVRFAKEAGARALLLGPGLVGFDTLRAIADDDSIALPLLSHPTWLGSHVVSPIAGHAHGVLFGLLQRLAGVDASIYPNFGGRFGFSQEECQQIASACLAPMGPLRPCCPTPGGGMRLSNLEAMKACYGDEVMYLMGGGLLELSSDLTQASRQLLSALGRA
ncbi:RuBisCO large subunit C-terminal-like domain-containing protein [Archangium violaceum]|uniref:RuBisCO large subunit C-terminal-like domain-containing protein n=1 Tax=Archangium violaceum TaxID=83451 RepID=UPI0037BFAF2E